MLKCKPPEVWEETKRVDWKADTISERNIKLYLMLNVGTSYQRKTPARCVPKQLDMDQKEYRKVIWEAHAQRCQIEGSDVVGMTATYDKTRADHFAFVT